MDMTMPPQGAQPAQDMPEQPGPAVTITKQADGSYSVAPETDEAATTAETPAMEGQEAGQGQTAKTLDEALDLAAPCWRAAPTKACRSSRPSPTASKASRGTDMATIQIMLRDTEDGLVDVETTVTGWDLSSNALALTDRLNAFMAEIDRKSVV